MLLVATDHCKDVTYGLVSTGDGVSCFGTLFATQKACRHSECAAGFVADMPSAIRASADDSLHVHSPVEVSSCAIDDALPRCATVCGRSNGAVVPGGQSGQVASGAYDLVLRDFCLAPVSMRLQALSRRVPPPLQ